MTITGFFIGGVANLISAAVSADLGRSCGDEALATVTGVVDGTGSIGAALGQLLIPLITHLISWRAVFYLFIAMTVLTMVCLLPLMVRELRTQGLWQRRPETVGYTPISDQEDVEQEQRQQHNHEDADDSDR